LLQKKDMKALPLILCGAVAVMLSSSLAVAGGHGGTSGSSGAHYVAPHTTKAGTYVDGHYQSNPNGSKSDNWSTAGNVNPYTGKAGTKSADGVSGKGLAAPSGTVPLGESGNALYRSDFDKPTASLDSYAPKALLPQPAKRSTAMKDAYTHLHPCPATGNPGGPCPGYVVDHITPLCAGGSDRLTNMQWQTVAEGKRKDADERRLCAKR
jgi:hypothetical protein